MKLLLCGKIALNDELLELLEFGETIEALSQPGEGKMDFQGVLVYLRPHSIPALCQALSHENERVRVCAVQCLRDICLRHKTPECKKAIPFLITALSDFMLIHNAKEVGQCESMLFHTFTWR